MEKAIIYGIKKNNKFHYIGKTTKRRRGVIKENLVISDIHNLYNNHNTRDVILNNREDLNFVEIQSVDINNWYDEKLREVVKKYGENNPLVNADWMKEGKRGFWEGKPRDKHTIYRLSQSKFKKIIEYNQEGNLVKIWDSGKEIGEKIFNDYQVVNGSSKSEIYGIVRKGLHLRFEKNSYWFRFEELLTLYGGIPANINPDDFVKQYKVNRKPTERKVTRSYSIIECDEYFNKIKIHPDVSTVTKKYGITETSIRRHCRKGRALPNGHILIYGEKTLKPI